MSWYPELKQKVLKDKNCGWFVSYLEGPGNKMWRWWHSKPGFVWHRTAESQEFSQSFRRRGGGILSFVTCAPGISARQQETSKTVSQTFLILNKRRTNLSTLLFETRVRSTECYFKKVPYINTHIHMNRSARSHKLLLKWIIYSIYIYAYVYIYIHIHEYLL